MKHIKLFEAYEDAETISSLPKDIYPILTKYNLVKKDFKWQHKTKGELGGGGSTWQLDSPSGSYYYRTSIYSSTDSLNAWVKYRKLLVDIDPKKNIAYVGAVEYGSDKTPKGFSSTVTMDLKAKSLELAIKSIL